MRKIGILSFVFHNWNFGGMLQGYALSMTLKKNGYYARQIRNTWKSVNGKFLIRIGKRLIFQSRFLFDLYDRYARRNDARELRNFRSFEKMIPFSSYFASTNIDKSNKKFDCFVAGSDQIWNVNYRNEQEIRMYGLLFADNSKRKISYAASIGAEQTAFGHELLFREILSNMDYISVREKAAKEYLQPLTDKPVAVTADPTLLLTKKEWDEIAIMPDGTGEYAFAYFLKEKDNRHDRELRYILDELQLSMICIADEVAVYPRRQDKQILDAGPREFVGYIKNAEVVLTNSFHGMVFAVLYNKPFWVFKRNLDHDATSMNHRIMDFLEELGLENRLIQNGEFPAKEKLGEKIDYVSVNQIIEKKRAYSIDWLRNAIDAK